MTRFRTLRSRLTAIALVSATVVVTVMVVLFNVVLAHVLDNDVDGKLRTQAAAVATTVRIHDGAIAVRESPEDSAIDSLTWVFQGLSPVVRPPAPRTVELAAEGLAGRSRAFAQVGDHEARLYALPIARDGRQVGTVVVGEWLGPYDRTTDIALVASAVLAALVLAAVFAVTWWTIGRALAPVTAMTRSAAEWNERDPQRRFGSAPRPDELGALAATFDALLDRVAASLRHEQRFSAELSHELRTPLARITAEMELLQRRERSPEDRGEAYAVVARSVEQMTRILETLLAAARVDLEREHGRSAVGDVLRRVSHEWAPVLAEREVVIAVHADDAGLVAGVEPEVLERILAPLLDNAGRHASSVVDVAAERRDGRVHITVRDDGPGVESGEEEAIFAPGVRGRSANGHRGAGLGLPLARRLARAAGGDVAVARGDEDGRAAFVVHLPA